MVQLIVTGGPSSRARTPTSRRSLKITDPAELLKPDGTSGKGDTKTINRVDTIGVVEAGKDGGTIYAATTGK